MLTMLLSSSEKKKNRSGKVFFLVLLLFFCSVIYLRLTQNRLDDVLIAIHDNEFRVLVANTPEQRYIGLGGRETLAPFDAMLFQYSVPDRYGIVMRDMQFPLDVIWIANGEIVDIAPNVPLEPEATEETLTAYQPRIPATIILEFPAGAAETYQFRIGDRVRLIEG